MTTPPLDLPALRDRCVKALDSWTKGPTPPYLVFDASDVLALLDRVEELKQACDDLNKDVGFQVSANVREHTRAEAAEAKVAAVRELHALDTHVCECGDTHGPYCKTCQYDYPCPTIRALDGTP